ncbi:MAG: hypothetical protein JSW11_06480 [Candidatus Heimdallarchaeota archaeon]|nr:MAG: hypothetical protein JSW11_06480 [Candidatus Heimdallarchaeota archaeon]
MFGRKRQKWLTEAQMAQTPIKLREMAPKENPSEVASFLRKKIGSKELNGFVSFDDKEFIPLIFIQQYITRKLAKGYVDICDVIDRTNLPGELLETLIKVNVQNTDGFFDQIHRKFYTLQGAKAELKQILSTVTSLNLKFLLNKLYWTEDHFEGILEVLAQDGHFVGYIDPITQRLHNFTSLDFSSSSGLQRNIKRLNRYIDTSFLLESEVSLKHISKLTRLTKENCLQLLENNREDLKIIFSANYEYLYPTMDIISQVLKDIFVFRDIPIEFWLHRLDVDRIEFLNILQLLNRSLKGTLNEVEFQAPSLKDWFETGIAVENLASSLNLDPLKLLNRLHKLGRLFGLRLTAGETADPFLVKGMKHFDIFCQVDTSSYTDPNLYFECQNCRRIMCSNCRSTGSTHVCPFCGNISAFIIDLPRHCPDCMVNYTHSFNLLDTEECHFCKKGPLKLGWTEYEIFNSKKPDLDSTLLEYLEQTPKAEIPLQEIIQKLNRSDRETVALLENHILHGKIQGWINIQKMTLHIAKQKEEFLCGVCEVTHEETTKYLCPSCDVNVCVDCFKEMISVGMVFCPECGGDLEEHQ